MKVYNKHMQPVDYDAAVNIMSDEIRDELNRSMAPCSEQTFYDVYCKEHERVFGTEFEPEKEVGQW